MTFVELLGLLLNALGFVILYMFIGFGPGFIFGIIIANRIFGRDQTTLMQQHKENIGKAADFNKQWDPANEKWV